MVQSGLGIFPTWIKRLSKVINSMDTRKLSDERLSQLGKYFELKDAVDELVRIIKSAPNDEYKQVDSSLLMVQRIDLWCAGPTKVEAAVKHLSRLGQTGN